MLTALVHMVGRFPTGAFDLRCLSILDASLGSYGAILVEASFISSQRREDYDSHWRKTSMACRRGQRLIFPDHGALVQDTARDGICRICVVFLARWLFTPELPISVCVWTLCRRAQQPAVASYSSFCGTQTH